MLCNALLKSWREHQLAARAYRAQPRPRQAFDTRRPCTCACHPPRELSQMGSLGDASARTLNRVGRRHHDVRALAYRADQ